MSYSIKTLYYTLQGKDFTPGVQRYSAGSAAVISGPVWKKTERKQSAVFVIQNLLELTV